MSPIPTLLPNQCPSCGAQNALSRFENQTFVFECPQGSVTIANLYGFSCCMCGDDLFDEESQFQYANALDTLLLLSKGSFSFV